MKPAIFLIVILSIFIGMLFVVKADNSEPEYIGELPAIEIVE